MFIIKSLEPVVRAFFNQEYWHIYTNAKRTKVKHIPKGRYEVLFLDSGKKKVLTQKQMQKRCNFEMTMASIYSLGWKYIGDPQKVKVKGDRRTDKKLTLADARRLVYALFSKASV